MITDESTGGVILTKAEWKNRIRPGMKLSMAMVVKKPRTNTVQHTCPSCQLTYTGIKTKDLERVKW